MLYWGKEILHETSIGNGQWKTLHNRLLLMSHDRKTLKNIPYQYKNDTLVLLYEHDYTITLERTRAHKK
jgi:hypothetical protein